MSDLEEARQLFTDAGLAFPTIPDEELAGQLEKREERVYSTTPVKSSPYMLSEFVAGRGTDVEEYAILSQAGHGINSYAIQYYVALGPLRMFLFLGWGGAYMDEESKESQIATCFALAGPDRGRVGGARESSDAA